jgi:hypothetical protein
MRSLAAMMLIAAANLGWAAAPPGQTRDLTEQEQKEVAALDARFIKLTGDGEFEQAVKVLEKIADYRRTRQGARHWQAIDVRFTIEDWRRLATVAVKDRGGEEKGSG